MGRKVTPLTLLFSAIILFASCLGSDSDSTTYYGDTAITAFSLGTLNRYLLTTSKSGTDSVYKKTLTGSKYKFYIDQQQKQIYNPDSLPCSTDAAHVICTVSSKNSGSIIIKNVDSDTLKYYSSTDSINFSSPREFRVYANDGSGYSAYSIHVNVHKEDSATFRWSAITSNTVIASMKGMKAVANGGKIFVFGNVGGATHACYTNETDGTSWTTASSNINTQFAADAYKNVIVKGGMIYMLSGGAIYRSADGENWAEMSQSSMKKLIGASSTELYGVNESGALVRSTDDGATWTAETIDDSADKLPTQDISYSCTALSTNDSTDHVVIVGNRDVTAYPSDADAMVWGKQVEYSKGSSNNTWMYYDIAEDNNYALPRLANLTIAPYYKGMIAIGGDGEGGSTAKAFSQIYYSADGGVTWLKDNRFPMPTNFSSSKTVFAMTIDSTNHVWIICGDSGKIWRGRLNELGWATNQTEFTK